MKLPITDDLNQLLTSPYITPQNPEIRARVYAHIEKPYVIGNATPEEIAGIRATYGSDIADLLKLNIVYVENGGKVDVCFPLHKLEQLITALDAKPLPPHSTNKLDSFLRSVANNACGISFPYHNSGNIRQAVSHINAYNRFIPPIQLNASSENFPSVNMTLPQWNTILEQWRLGQSKLATVSDASPTPIESSAAFAKPLPKPKPLFHIDLDKPKPEHKLLTLDPSKRAHDIPDPSSTTDHEVVQFVDFAKRQRIK